MTVHGYCPRGDWTQAPGAGPCAFAGVVVQMLVVLTLLSVCLLRRGPGPVGMIPLSMVTPGVLWGQGWGLRPHL